MRGVNIVASIKWAKTAASWALRGIVLAALVGPIAAASVGGDIGNRILLFLLLVVGIALVFAAVPLTVALWFLFLHMLWQAGRAARGINQEK